MKRCWIYLSLVVLLALTQMTVLADAQPITIDVKPGSSATYAPVNLSSGGTVVVAVPTTSSLDAESIDGATVTLNDVAAWRTFLTDYDKDGDQDLMCQFLVQELGLPEGQSIVVLMATTVDGIALTGSGGVDAEYVRAAFPGKGR